MTLINWEAKLLAGTEYELIDNIRSILFPGWETERNQMNTEVEKLRKQLGACKKAFHTIQSIDPSPQINEAIAKAYTTMVNIEEKYSRTEEKCSNSYSEKNADPVG